MINTPVYPIPVSFTKEGDLNSNEITDYLTYLERHNVEVIMTTSGTSQFNLLDIKEIRKLNDICMNFKGQVILGLPALSGRHLVDEIEYINKKVSLNNIIGIMLIYPERYYNDEDVVKFFKEVSFISDLPVYIHGLPMKDFRGNIHNYSSKLINTLMGLRKISGIKEESSSLDIAYEVCKDIIKHKFDVIVAGGSQRRYYFLYPTGVRSFLAGIGSIFPIFDLEFHSYMQSGNMGKAYDLLVGCENPFFDIFMSIGWHKSLHEGLRQMGLMNSFGRSPFYELNEEQKEEIRIILNLLKGYNGSWYGF